MAEENGPLRDGSRKLTDNFWNIYHVHPTDLRTRWSLLAADGRKCSTTLEEGTLHAGGRKLVRKTDWKVRL